MHVSRRSFAGSIRLWVVCAAPCAIATASLAGCPTARNDDDGGTGPSASSTKIAPVTSVNDPSVEPATDPTTEPRQETAPVRDDAIVLSRLSPGAALPIDPLVCEPSCPGLAITYALSWLDAAAHPPTSPSLDVVLGEGRARVRFDGEAFAMPAGASLAMSRGRLGFVYTTPERSQAVERGYRVVPAGALRAFFVDRRADVVPLLPTQLGPVTETTRDGRNVERVTVRTAYGVLDLEQMTIEPRRVDLQRDRSAPSGAVVEAHGAPIAIASAAPVAADGGTDAGTPHRSRRVDGAGDSVCRMLLELIGADRALAGEPCSVDSVPVFARVTMPGGGGFELVASRVQERDLLAVDVAFPPRAAHLAQSIVDDVRPLMSADSLLSLHARGDVALLTLRDRGSEPRVTFLDGLPTAWLPPARELQLAVRAGHYALEWRTALGERIAQGFVDAPGVASNGGDQLNSSPSPSASVSPIASARKGP